MNDLSEIWNLSQTKVTDHLVLTFGDDISISEIYHEAYFNNIWILIEENIVTKNKVCRLPLSINCDLVAKQMIHTCIIDNSVKPTYSGELNKTSIRTALYRHARKTGHNIKTGIHGGVVYCMLNNEDNIDVSSNLKSLAVNYSTQLEIPDGSSVDNLRSAVFNFGKRNNVKFSTRYINGKLRVKRLDDDKIITGTVTGEFIKWLDTTPWDVQLPIPEIEGLTLNSMAVTANRHYGGVFSFSNGKVTRNSFRLCKEQGQLVFRVKGVVMITFDVSRRTQLTSDDWLRINGVLKAHNVTDEVLI